MSGQGSIEGGDCSQSTTRHQELELLRAISSRALRELHDSSEVARPRRLDTLMQVFACHTQACPLDLQALLNASLADFAHDIQGLQEHFNPMTGQLEAAFRPRAARLVTPE